VIAVIAAAAVAWLTLLILAPVLPAGVAAALYAVGSHICHQRAERSFHLAGAQLPVCARCAGIYAGATAGCLLAVSERVRIRLLASAPRTLLLSGAVPTAVTLVAEWSGAWSGSNAVRGAAGIPLGLAVAFVVAQGAATLHYGGCAPRRPIASNRPSTPI